MDIEIKDDSIITLYKLSHGQPENGKVNIGRLDIGKFVSIPEIALVIIQLLQKGKSVSEVEDIVNLHREEAIDVKDFIYTLIDLDFVKSVNNVYMKASETKKKNHLSFIRQKHVKWLNNPLLISVGILFVFISWISLFIFIGNAPLRPSVYFWSDFAVINLSINGLIFWLLATIHEYAHLLAARSLGIPANIGIRHKAYVLITAYTDVTGVWVRSKKERIFVFTAGIFSDGLIGAFGIVYLILFSPKGIGYDVSQIVIFSSFLKLLFQFAILFKTDLYFVLMETIKKDIREQSINFLQRVYKRLRNKKVKHLAMKSNFLPLLLTSITAVTFLVALFYSFFISIGFIISSYNEVVYGAKSSNITYLLSGLFVFIVQIIGLVLFVYNGTKSIFEFKDRLKEI